MHRLLSLRTRVRHQRFFCSRTEQRNLETQVDKATIATSKPLPSAWLQHPELNADWQVVKREHFAVRRSLSLSTCNTLNDTSA